MVNDWWKDREWLVMGRGIAPKQLTEEQIIKAIGKPDNMPDYLIKEPKNEQEK